MSWIDSFFEWIESGDDGSDESAIVDCIIAIAFTVAVFAALFYLEP